MSDPATLDRAGIAARIPHAGSMCLLESLLGWDAEHVDCLAADHGGAHPLRSAGGLHASAAVEYASQAMALHATLAAGPAGDARPGLLASARNLRLHVRYLDDAPAPLRVTAWRLAGDADQALYRFELRDAAGLLLAAGRTAVVIGAAPKR